MSALSDPDPWRGKRSSKSVVHIMGLLVEKVATDFGNHCLNLCFLLHEPVLFF